MRYEVLGTGGTRYQVLGTRYFASASTSAIVMKVEHLKALVPKFEGKTASIKDSIS